MNRCLFNDCFYDIITSTINNLLLLKNTNEDIKMRLKTLVAAMLMITGSQAYAFFNEAEVDSINQEAIQKAKDKVDMDAEKARAESALIQAEILKAETIASEKSAEEQIARKAKELADSEAQKAKMESEAINGQLIALKAQLEKEKSDRVAAELTATEARASEAQATAQAKQLIADQAQANNVIATESAETARNEALESVKSLEAQIKRERDARSQAEKMIADAQRLLAEKEAEAQESKTARIEAERLRLVAEKKADKAESLSLENADRAEKAKEDARISRQETIQAERNIAKAMASEKAAIEETKKIRESSVKKVSFSEGWSVGGFGYSGINAETIVGFELKKDISESFYLSAQFMDISFGEYDTEELQRRRDLGIAESNVVQDTPAAMVNLGFHDNFGSSNVGFYTSLGLGIASDPQEDESFDSFDPRFDEFRDSKNPINSKQIFGAEIGLTYEIWKIRTKIGYKHISTLSNIGGGIDSFGAGLNFRF